MSKRTSASAWLACALGASIGMFSAARLATGCAEPPPEPDFYVVEGGRQRDGGDEGDATVPDDPTAPCPQPGPPAMVRVGAPGPTFCIDSTEVTRDQYAAFLAKSPSLANQPTSCMWNKTLVPGGDWADGGASTLGDVPVTHVDWCDAVAYCTTVGKRLCGAVGGGPLTFEATGPVSTVGQAYVACSRGGKQRFPYGDTYVASACNGDADGGRPLPVKSFQRCQGGYPGLFDMVGNVQEWRDGCEVGSATGEEDRCFLGGGGFSQPPTSLTCEKVFRAPRTFTNFDLGFRCCGP